jgi:hypothetical protein
VLTERSFDRVDVPFEAGGEVARVDGEPIRADVPVDAGLAAVELAKPFEAVEVYDEDHVSEVRGDLGCLRDREVPAVPAWGRGRPFAEQPLAQHRVESPMRDAVVADVYDAMTPWGQFVDGEGFGQASPKSCSAGEFSKQLRRLFALPGA